MVKLIPNVITDTVQSIGSVIDTLGLTPEAKRRAERELQRIEQEGQANLRKHVEAMAAKQRDVIVAEAEGQGWMQRNWRPLLMMVFIAIIAMQYLLAPFALMFGIDMGMMELPSELWTILTISVSGYIGLRSAEKAAPAIVDMVNKARGREAIEYVYEDPITEELHKRIVSTVPQIESPERQMPQHNPKEGHIAARPPKVLTPDHIRQR